MTENEVAAVVVDASMKVHSALGVGLLESVYEAALFVELTNRGLRVERQRAISATYEGVALGDAFRADLIVEGLVIVELKSAEKVSRTAFKVLLTYLRLSGLRLGLLINFGEPHLRNGIDRVVNGLC